MLKETKTADFYCLVHTSEWLKSAFKCRRVREIALCILAKLQCLMVGLNMKLFYFILTKYLSKNSNESSELPLTHVRLIWTMNFIIQWQTHGVMLKSWLVKLTGQDRWLNQSDSVVGSEDFLSSSFLSDRFPILSFLCPLW